MMVEIKTYDDAVRLVALKLGVGEKEAERRAKAFSREMGLDDMAGMLVFMEEEDISLGIDYKIV